MNGFMDQWWRVGGVCGILLLVTFVVGAIAQGGEPPAFDDPIGEIRAFWQENGNDYLVGDFIIGAGFILFFLPFLSALRSVLGQAEGGVQMWSRIVFGGGVLFFALAGICGAPWTTLAWGGVAENASDDTIQLLMWLDVTLNHFVPAGIVVFALPAAMVMLRTRVLPTWLGILTLIVGVIALLSMLSILADSSDDNYGFVAWPLSAIWILATSIVLIMKKEAPAMTGQMSDREVSVAG
jgi:hypothetical protein